jgi:tetratricopeptide (TPR) repeat protein
MKKHILLIAVAILVAINAFAQQGNYEAAIGQNLEHMRAAKTLEEYQQVANLFERIAAAEQKEWLPAYYASLTYINMTNREQDGDKKDQLLDKAQQHLDKAMKLTPKESELHVLQGLLHLTRINVSPMARGMKYSGLATESFEKAKALNPENPRAYYMLGSTKFNTPKMFGGGPEAAKPYLAAAKDKYAQAKPASPIAPAWGEKATEQLLAKFE